VIELRAKDPKKGAKGLQAQVLAACHQCRSHHSLKTMHVADHCRFIKAALHFARREKWEPCLLNLLHDRKAPAIPSKRMAAGGGNRDTVTTENPNWLDHECSPGELARFILDELELMVQQPYPEGPKSATLRTDIQTNIDECRNHPRDETDTGGTNSTGGKEYFTAAQHCQLIDSAYDYAALKNWDQCNTELDHMVGGSTDDGKARAKKE
jgi:hypothetical protein